MILFEEFTDILTPAEAMEALNIGKNMIYTLLSTGQLKAFRVGRTWRIPKCSVEEYIFHSVRNEYSKKFV